MDLAGSALFTSDSAYFMMEKVVKYGAKVPEADRPKVRAALAAKLARITYEGGQPVFVLTDARPYQRAKGELVVTVLPNGVSRRLLLDGAPLDGAVKQIVEHSGGHASLPPGVFVAAGPDIDPKADLRGVRIHDITPTLLYGMGLPVADDFDGKAYTQLYTAPFRAARPLARIATYGKQDESRPTTSETDEAMLEQLRSLGYIE